jgi:hypothetical protein
MHRAICTRLLTRTLVRRSNQHLILVKISVDQICSFPVRPADVVGCQVKGSDLLNCLFASYKHSFLLNGVWPRCTYRYLFEQQSQAMLGLVTTWMGDCPIVKYAGCCWELCPYIVAWKGVGEDTRRSYSVSLRKISQNASRKILYSFVIGN